MKTLLTSVLLLITFPVLGQEDSTPAKPDRCPKYRITPKSACFPAEDRLSISASARENDEKSAGTSTKERAEKDCQDRLEALRAAGRKELLGKILGQVRGSCSASKKLDATSGEKECKPVDTSGIPFPSSLSDDLKCSYLGPPNSVSWEIKGKVFFKGNIDVLCDP